MLLSFSDPSFHHLRNAISSNIICGRTGRLISSTPDFRRKKTLESFAQEKVNISSPSASPLPSPLVLFLQNCPLEGTQALQFSCLTSDRLPSSLHACAHLSHPAAQYTRSQERSKLAHTTPAQPQPRPSTVVPGNASFLRSRYRSRDRWSFASLGRQGLFSMILSIKTVSGVGL